MHGILKPVVLLLNLCTLALWTGSYRQLKHCTRTGLANHVSTVVKASTLSLVVHVFRVHGVCLSCPSAKLHVHVSVAILRGQVGGDLKPCPKSCPLITL